MKHPAILDIEDLRQMFREEIKALKQEEDTDIYITVHQAAEILGESVRSVYRRIERNQYPSVRKESGKFIKLLKSEVLNNY